jgi:hypothetical protein
MPDDAAPTFQVDDAQIIFRNFSGEEGQYNVAGDRNFAVILDQEIAERLAADGWAVRSLKPREEGDEETPYISIKVNFKNRPPRIVMLTSTSRTQLDQDSVGVLDWADIESADLIARAYNWEVGGKSGIKAYLQTLFVTIAEDALEKKYAINENPPTRS